MKKILNIRQNLTVNISNIDVFIHKAEMLDVRNKEIEQLSKILPKDCESEEEVDIVVECRKRPLASVADKTSTISPLQLLIKCDSLPTPPPLPNVTGALGGIRFEGVCG